MAALTASVALLAGCGAHTVPQAERDKAHETAVAFIGAYDGVRVKALPVLEDDFRLMTARLTPDGRRIAARAIGPYVVRLEQTGQLPHGAAASFAHRFD